jgi:hypothetical protein
MNITRNGRPPFRDATVLVDRRGRAASPRPRRSTCGCRRSPQPERASGTPTTRALGEFQIATGRAGGAPRRRRSGVRPTRP